MASPHRQVINEINDAIVVLIERGLASDQNFPHEKEVAKDTFRVQYSDAESSRSSLRNYPYGDTYQRFREHRSYNVLMLDGAMLQLFYEFRGHTLMHHRLAFFPSPNLLEYQNNSELYLEDQMYADVIHRGAVTVPIRFDYDNSPGVSNPIQHPTSHLTLGQYRDCRIPVSSGVTPHAFFDFIIRSFYNTASSSTGTKLKSPRLRFEESIFDEERNLIHICTPTPT